MRKTTIFLLLTLLLVQTAVASFDIRVSDADSIYANEVAYYNVLVTNTGGSSETIELDLSLDPKWGFETDPLIYLSPFTLLAGGVAEFDILLVPTSPLLSSGTYGIIFPFVAKSGEIKEADVFLHIKNPNALTDYAPSLSFVLDAQEAVDPRQIAKIKLEIRNRNPLDIPEMIVDLQSDLYSETQIVPIEPLGATTVVFEIDYDAQQQPIDDLLEITVSVGETSFAPIRKEIYIVPYEEIVEFKKPSEGFFFRTKTVTEYTNNGNVDVVELIRYPTTGFARFFTVTEPSGEVIDDSGLLYYATSVSLPMNESVSVVHVVSYRPLVLLFLLICLGIGAYYKFRAPIVVTKETIVQHVDQEGCMKIKVLIHVKNRSMSLVYDLRVHDKIPAVAEIEKHFEMGTLKPVKILKHEKAGTILTWDIHHLEAYEERIITYKVRSIYSIVGNFTLPEITVQYKDAKDALRKVTSNSSKVGKKVE